MLDYIIIGAFVVFMFILINGMNREVMNKHIKRIEENDKNSSN